LSQAQIAFTADQMRCLAPFDQELTGKLAKRFTFADTSMQSTGDQTMWIYQKGVCKLSDTRKVLIASAHGYEIELSVTVEGATEDAIDVLRELWTVLGEIAEEEPLGLDQSLGTFAYQTTAIVRLPKTYRELFPGLDLLARHTREGIRAPLTGAPGVETFHVETRVSFAVGALTLDRATIIEPRHTSKADDRVFYTQSPLRSDRHLAMLEALCGMG
jgi:hypothetical protein